MTLKSNIFKKLEELESGGPTYHSRNRSLPQLPFTLVESQYERNIICRGGRKFPENGVKYDIIPLHADSAFDDLLADLMDDIAL